MTTPSLPSSHHSRHPSDPCDAAYLTLQQPISLLYRSPDYRLSLFKFLFAYVLLGFTRKMTACCVAAALLVMGAAYGGAQRVICGGVEWQGGLGKDTCYTHTHTHAHTHTALSHSDGDAVRHASVLVCLSLSTVSSSSLCPSCYILVPFH